MRVNVACPVLVTTAIGKLPGSWFNSFVIYGERVTEMGEELDFTDMDTPKAVYDDFMNSKLQSAVNMTLMIEPIASPLPESVV